MARIRTIKPSLFKNEDLAELPLSARMLFIGLFCLADKEGRLEDRPKRIKAELFPYDNIEVHLLLEELHNAGFIRRYAAGAIKIIQVINFTKHQRITGKEALTESELPEQQLSVALAIPEKQRGNNGETPEQHLGRQEGKGMEKEGKGKEEAQAPAKKVFNKPDESEVTDFFEEIGMDQFTAIGQAQNFCNYYCSNGWVIGKARSPMKDWKAAARNWKNRMNEFKIEKHGTHQQSPANSKQFNNNSFIQRAFAKHSGQPIERGAEGSAA
jgi:hypothetical protein